MAAKLKYRVTAPAGGHVLGDRLEAPRTIFGRGLGLMFRRSLEPGGGMWISPCNGIHMFWMRFAIDAVFVDKRHRVLKVYPGLKPWRVVPLVWGAAGVLELPAGTLAGIELKKGDELHIDPV
jgi:uncharacterized membrane protein (UPF0127 family)